MTDRRSDLRDVRTIFHAVAPHVPIVFLGGRALPLYSRLEGPPLRATLDVDAIAPTMTSEFAIAENRLMKARALKPNLRLEKPRRTAFLVGAEELALDIIDADSTLPWIRSAYESAGTFDAGDNTRVRAVTPPYYLLLKWEAFMSTDRPTRARSIVTISKTS